MRWPKDGEIMYDCRASRCGANVSPSSSSRSRIHVRAVKGASGARSLRADFVVETSRSSAGELGAEMEADVADERSSLHVERSPDEYCESSNEDVMSERDVSDSLLRRCISAWLLKYDVEKRREGDVCLLVGGVEVVHAGLPVVALNGPDRAGEASCSGSRLDELPTRRTPSAVPGRRA